MEYSRKGLLFTACREALVRVGYQDGRHLSIGFGHNDQTLKPGDAITVKQAFELLIQDCSVRAKTVTSLLTRPVKQNQFDSLVDLLFQAGRDDLEPTIAYVNAGDMKEAVFEYLRHDMSQSGEHFAGLFTRRVRGACVMEAAEYGDLSWCYHWPTGNPRTTKPEVYLFQEGDLP